MWSSFGKSSACPRVLGDFCISLDFLFHRGGGTDINWNNPRRCVWVEVQKPEKFYNSMFSNCMGGKFIVLKYRKKYSNGNSIGGRTFRIYCFHIEQKGRCVWVEIQ